MPLGCGIRPDKFKGDYLGDLLYIIPNRTLAKFRVLDSVQ